MRFSEEQLERYSRHFVLREIGAAGQKRLLESKVLVIGAGGLGSPALLYLAAAGVGTIGVADFDRVDRSNLQRQILHRADSVGMDKVLSAKRAIQQLNPDVTVQVHGERMTADNIRDAIAPYDFVIDATDRFESKFLVNDACVLSEKPYSHAGVVRFEGQAMTYLPHRGPCLRCLVGSVPPEGANLTCARVGVLGAVVGILGSIQATEAIKYLLGAGEPLTGRVLHLDALTMRVSFTDIPGGNPHCGVCGKNPTILSLRDNRREYEIAD